MDSAQQGKSVAVERQTAGSNDESVRTSVGRQMANGPVVSLMTLLSDTAYHSFVGEVEALNTTTIRRLTLSPRHQLLAIARGPGAQRSAGRCSRPYRRPLSRTLRCQIAVSAARRWPCNRW